MDDFTDPIFKSIYEAFKSGRTDEFEKLPYDPVFQCIYESFKSGPHGDPERIQPTS